MHGRFSRARAKASKAAEPVDVAEVEQLWQQGALGESDPPADDMVAQRWEHEGVTNISNSNLVISSIKRFLMAQISLLSFPMNVAQKHEQVRLKRAQMHHSRVCDISHQ